MGAEVTVLSQSLRKQDDGLRLGADHYYATSDQATFETLAGQLRPDRQHGQRTDRHRRLPRPAAPDGALVNVGAPPEPLPVQAFALIRQRRSFAGSSIGGIRETQEMLDFCAEHGIAAEIEVIPADADQRGVRAGARLRRPLPLRDRHRHPALTAGRPPRSANNADGPVSSSRGTGPSVVAEAGQARWIAAGLVIADVELDLLVQLRHVGHSFLV